MKHRCGARLSRVKDGGQTTVVKLGPYSFDVTFRALVVAVLDDSEPLMEQVRASLLAGADALQMEAQDFKPSIGALRDQLDVPVWAAKQEPEYLQALVSVRIYDDRDFLASHRSASDRCSLDHNVLRHSASCQSGFKAALIAAHTLAIDGGYRVIKTRHVKTARRTSDIMAQVLEKI